jgi:hypothetical protein
VAASPIKCRPPPVIIIAEVENLGRSRLETHSQVQMLTCGFFLTWRQLLQSHFRKRIVGRNDRLFCPLHHKPSARTRPLPRLPCVGARDARTSVRKEDKSEDLLSTPRLAGPKRDVVSRRESVRRRRLRRGGLRCQPTKGAATSPFSSRLTNSFAPSKTCDDVVLKRNEQPGSLFSPMAQAKRAVSAHVS